MTWQTIEQYNATTPDMVILYVMDIWNGFVPMLLFVFFMIILLASYFSQRRTTGRGSFPSSFAVAGFSTAVLSILVSIGVKITAGEVGGVIILSMVVSIVVASAGVLWLLSSRDSL